jgi:5-methylcytosine-specific restriction endonuclease McrA
MPSRRPFDSWYKSRQWLARRKHQIQIEPTCAWCAKRGHVTPATVADHVTPCHDDKNAFLTGELQSLCARCHNGKWASDKRGFQRDIGADGFPIDPAHPFNLLATKEKTANKD